MNSAIPAFKASLVQNVNVNKPSAPSVEEILGSEDVPQPEQTAKSSGSAMKVVYGAVALAGLGFLGHRGTFGKSIQKLLGGTPKLSIEQIQEQIASKLSDYISRTEATPFVIKILGNGKTTASRVLANGEKEIISFAKESGLPEFRVLFGKSKGNNALNYTTYKGADILDDGFDNVNNFYKKFSRNSISRKHLFGQKHNEAKIVYGDMVRGDAKSEVLRHTTYYKNGNVNRIVKQDKGSCTTTVQDMLYNKNKDCVGFDVMLGDGTIVRKIKGENPVMVPMLNRKDNIVRRILQFFSLEGQNVVK